jgi:hypothetical protein
MGFHKETLANAGTTRGRARPSRPAITPPARCGVCGGPAWQLLTSSPCAVEGGCPGARVELEPEEDGPIAAWTAARGGLLPAGYEGSNEVLWRVAGRGEEVVHPLRDVAAAMWRERVANPKVVVVAPGFYSGMADFERAVTAAIGSDPEAWEVSYSEVGGYTVKRRESRGG